MTQSIKTLIERLEQASGPDRELDVLIAAEIDWKGPLVHRPVKKFISDVGGVAEAVKDIREGHPLNAFRCIPEYSASIDSALTLVQDGWRWRVERYNTDETKCHAELAQVGQIRDFGIGIKCRAQADAKTPAIALCIAALKSREAQT